MVAAINNTQAILLAGGLVLVWLVPYVIDQAASYKRDRRIREQVIVPLIEGTSIEQISDGKLKEVASILRDNPPSGISGLVRALIALTIVSIVGAALFFTFSSDADTELRKTIVTAILAILGTVAGFYFGSKSVQDAAAASLPTVLGTPAMPAIASITFDPPSPVEGGTTIKVTVTLSAPALMGGSFVTLGSDVPEVDPPRTLTFPAGASSATGDVTTKRVNEAKKAKITASLSGVQSTATEPLTVTPREA